MVNNHNQLKGKIKVNDLLKAGDQIKSSNPLIIRETDTILDAIKKASNFVGESIPILGKDNTLLGVITEADLFSQYLEVQNKISDIEKD